MGKYIKGQIVYHIDDTKRKYPITVSHYVLSGTGTNLFETGMVVGFIRKNIKNKQVIYNEDYLEL